MATLLEKTRKITAILQEGLNNSSEELPYKGLSERLSAVIDCNSVVIDGHGDVLGYAMPYKTNNDRVEAMFDNRKLSTEYVQVGPGFVASILIVTDCAAEVLPALSVAVKLRLWPALSPLTLNDAELPLAVLLVPS